MNKNENNTEPKKTRMLTDEEAEQVTGGQNYDRLLQTILHVNSANIRSEIGFSFKEVEDAGSVNEEEN